MNNRTNIYEEKYFQKPEVCFGGETCQNQMSNKTLVSCPHTWQVDVLLEDVLLWQQWNCFENYPKTISRVVQKNANFSGHYKTGIS